MPQNVPTISKCPNYLKMSQLSQNVLTISDCPNYLKISQLTISKCLNFHQRVNLRAESYFSWKKTGLCENMWDDWIYAKLCGKSLKCAVNTKLCRKLRKMTNCAIPYTPHLNVAPGSVTKISLVCTGCLGSHNSPIKWMSFVPSCM